MTPAAEEARMLDDIEPNGAVTGQPLCPWVPRLRDFGLLVLALRAGIPLPTEAQVTGLQTTTPVRGSEPIGNHDMRSSRRRPVRVANAHVVSAVDSMGT